MDPRIHQAVGWIYFGPAWLSLFPINGIIGFMLTPGAGVAAGFWFLTRLPREVMLLFMGRSAAGTVLFAAGILFTALVLLTAYKRRVLPTVVLAVVLVYLMTFLRDFVRTGYLSPVFSPDQLKVAPQFGPMVLFAVALVAGNPWDGRVSRSPGEVVSRHLPVSTPCSHHDTHEHMHVHCGCRFFGRFR